MPRGKKDAFIKEGYFKCQCGREFNKSQSYYAHLSHCKVHLGDRQCVKRRYHTVFVEYTCKCGEVFNNSSSYIGHTSHCKVYLGEERYLENLEKTRKSVRIACEYARSSHTEEVNRRQSETRKRKYASGELTPAPGVGRGKYSYLTYEDKTIMLRSTYEFIYALYLLYQGIKFEYETIRVHHNDHVFISDFLVDNEIIEIKGNYKASTSQQRFAFELAGYLYKVMFWKDLEPCYEYLKTKVDIDSILSKIKEGHNKREYYEYKYVNERGNSL